jgi:hypothetical protein
MCLPKTINSIGLVFDIIGVLLIYFYGLPNRSAEEVKWESNVDKEKQLKRLSLFGLIFIGFGFILQLISNFL